jgi:predicted small secreted protein
MNFSGTSYTGDNTFANADLSKLENLNLNDTNFVTKEMTFSKASTAYRTFYNTNLQSIKNLDLSTTNFVVDDMTGNSINIAKETFLNSFKSEEVSLEEIHLPINYNFSS